MHISNAAMEVTMADKVTVQVQQIDASASQGLARGHQITMDRPPSKGGGDQGPMGGEVLLQGLGGCFMSNLLAAAVARGVTIKNAAVEIIGHVIPSPTRYTTIDMYISMDCEDHAMVPKLVEIAERGCLVANTLKAALPLNLHLNRP
jgi:putative redox protein